MRFLTILMLFCTSFAAQAERIDRTLNIGEPGNIVVDVVSGEVEIIGWDKSAVRVVGNVPNGDDSLVFKSRGDDIRIEVETEHGFWGGMKQGGNTTLKIYCPYDSSLRTEGASTSFTIKGIRGSVDVSTMSGNVDLEGGIGKVDLESVSGDVTVIDAKGQLNLSSVSGDVIADVLASIFDAETVSGNISAKIGNTESVELESVSGDIEINFELNDDARLEADTVSGDIDLNFDNDSINASFDIETGPGGDIRNRLSEDRSDNSFSLSGSLKFRLGNGEGSVNVDTMSGTVRLDK